MNKKNPKNQLISPQEAKRIMLKSAKVIKKIELKKVNECEDRILAQNIFSKVNIPEYDNSAVDGYAFNYKNLINNKKKILTIVGQSLPGKPFIGNVNVNEAIRVFTGSYMLNSGPLQIDTICFEEKCKILGDQIEILDIPPKGSNIRAKGEDLIKGMLVFEKGRKIRTVDLAQLSSVGIKKIKVFKKLKIGIFSTGNELIRRNSSKKKFKIYDSNKTVLLALFKKIGCDVVDHGILKDNLLESKKKLFSCKGKNDLIITSGGISRSLIDKIGMVFEKNGEIGFWGLSAKPGRPFAFGKINNVPFVGLPGNPVAAIITFFMLVIDFVKKIAGVKNFQLVERLLPSDFNLEKKIGRKEWIRGSIKTKKNVQSLQNFKETGSGIISSITQTDGIIEIDENQKKIKKGTLLKFFRYEDMLN